MSLSKKPYKGTRDFFPPQKRVLEYIFSAMKKTARSYGYEAYDGPMLEEVELYKTKSGEELVSDQIYSFYDRGKRFVAIRPEMTPTLARMIAQAYRELPLPIRWFSIPNLYRYERPQRGRLREHWQFNIDIFGAPENMGEIEILQVIISLMKNLKADQSMFKILINDRRVVNFVLQDLMNLNDDQSYKMYKIIDKYKKISRNDFDTMIEGLGLNSNQKFYLEKYLNIHSFSDIFEFLDGKGCIKDIFDFYQLLKNFSMDNYIHYDPSIVRGVDYYTGMVFEVYDQHPDNLRAICGGGAYANLLEVFNEKPLLGVGFGLGDVTLTDFLLSHLLLPDLSKSEVNLYLFSQTLQGVQIILALAQSIREKGFEVVTELVPLKFNKACQVADKKGAQFLASLSESSLSKGVIEIKNSRTRQGYFVSYNDIDKVVDILSLRS